MLNKIGEEMVCWIWTKESGWEELYVRSYMAMWIFVEWAPGLGLGLDVC